MPRALKIPDLAQLAKRYRVTERTVRRWHAAGADVESVESVADLLLRMRNPAGTALEYLLTELR